MFPAGFWSRESVRRLALQLEGERWASACPPLTARSRSARTNPLATDDRPLAVFDMDTSLASFLIQAWGMLRRPLYTVPGRRPSRDIVRDSGRPVPCLRKRGGQASSRSDLCAGAHLP